MGDAESTVKRFYVRTLAGTGKEWFDLLARRSEGNLFNFNASEATENYLQASETFATAK